MIVGFIIHEGVFLPHKKTENSVGVFFIDYRVFTGVPGGWPIFRLDAGPRGSAVFTHAEYSRQRGKSRSCAQRNYRPLWACEKSSSLINPSSSQENVLGRSFRVPHERLFHKYPEAAIQIATRV
jgi:hypothetical protein